MSGLNPQQREAIHYLDGPLLVLAGAGSGKTRVIAQKIAYLVRDCGFQPCNLAAITFTNKAAKEMQERVGKLLSRSTAEEMRISTFHSLGVRILREDARLLGYKPRFSIFDAADCAGIIGDVARTADKGALRHLQAIISNWKNALVTPEAARHLAGNEHQTLAAHAYRNPGNHKMTLAEQYLDSINIPGNFLITPLWAPVGLRYHATHHLFMSMPYHNLGKAQRRLVNGLTDNSQYIKTIRSGLWDALRRIWHESSLSDTSQRQ